MSDTPGTPEPEGTPARCCYSGCRNPATWTAEFSGQKENPLCSDHLDFRFWPQDLIPRIKRARRIHA